MDFCPNCERDIRVELEDLVGADVLIEEAASKEESWMPVKAGTAYIRLYCGCGSVRAQFSPGIIGSVFDVPDPWLEAFEPPQEAGE